MNAKKELVATIIKDLPEATRKRLNVGDFQLIMGAVSVKERIESFYRGCYSLLRTLNEWKQKNNFCSGEPTCMVNIGAGAKHKTCLACRKLAREQRARSLAGETRKIRRSDYGIIRMRERKAQLES